MARYLVRHAHAGSRSRWDGTDDSLRPLTDKGGRQARALAAALAPTAVGHVVSSPFLRCVETVQPLADERGVSVVTDARLREASPFVPVIDLLADLPDGSVLCSHGDVIPDVITALHRRGMVIVGEPLWNKASVWVVQSDGDEPFATATCWPPPHV